jgi:hypothetical protein
MTGSRESRRQHRSTNGTHANDELCTDRGEEDDNLLELLCSRSRDAGCSHKMAVWEAAHASLSLHDGSRRNNKALSNQKASTAFAAGEYIGPST